MHTHTHTPCAHIHIQVSECKHTYACVHIHAHTHTYTRAHAQSHTCAHAHMRSHTHTRVPDQNSVSQAWYTLEIHHSGWKPLKCTNISLCMHTHMQARIYRPNIHICMCDICTHKHTHIHMCGHTHTHTCADVKMSQPLVVALVAVNISCNSKTKMAVEERGGHRYK